MESNKQTAFNASAKGYASATAPTARAAALAFFERNPKARKCFVIQGFTDGPFFTVVYGRSSAGEWPQSFKNVTRKTAETL